MANSAGLVLYLFGWVLQFSKLRAPWHFPAPLWLRWFCLSPWTRQLSLKATVVQVTGLFWAGIAALTPVDSALVRLLTAVLGPAIAWAVLDQAFGHQIIFPEPSPKMKRRLKRRGG